MNTIAAKNLRCLGPGLIPNFFNNCIVFSEQEGHMAIVNIIITIKWGLRNSSTYISLDGFYFCD